MHYQVSTLADEQRQRHVAMLALLAVLERAKVVLLRHLAAGDSQWATTERHSALGDGKRFADPQSAPGHQPGRQCKVVGHGPCQGGYLGPRRYV
ncbi:hypothetical protein Ssi02_52420 [Sinosporangium siamense]|uniref:Uncharacterized protein n=1 Tax=Sinosporangium siamense TaxID=1367973 RepID=A0A919V977_9ACTN|nr:hypothetical protein Ssi02_52420 [Sinosporangium siamense]